MHAYMCTLFFFEHVTLISAWSTVGGCHLLDPQVAWRRCKLKSVAMPTRDIDINWVLQAIPSGHVPWRTQVWTSQSSLRTSLGKRRRCYLADHLL